VTTADKILKDLDKALSSLDKPDFDLKRTCDTVNKACKFLVGIIEQNAKEKEDLEAELDDMEDAVDALVEQNEIMQVDIQIILEFMKKSGIDMSYVVTRSDIAKKVKKSK
jgi:chromosome segregation ATPase